MPALPVVLNNTPLVCLWHLDRFDLLRDLFGSVCIPPGVQAEFLAVETVARRAALTAAPWIIATPLHNPRYANSFTTLDRGEAEVLALAIETGARLVIMDERRGRRFARHLQLTVTGTLGVLLLAKEAGLIAEAGPALKRLLEAGIYLAPAVVQRTLALAGEPVW